MGFNQENVDPQIGREICMQIASMNPVAVSREDVPQATIDSEISVAIEKTKQEMVRKAVEAALHKAGLNPNHFDSEDHIESNMSKGWITAEEAAKGREIIKTTSEYVQDGKISVGQFLEKSQKGLVAVAFKRVNLNQD